VLGDDGGDQPALSVLKLFVRLIAAEN